MYARVIVGTDGSPAARRAEPIAEMVAEAFDCPRALVHVDTGASAKGVDATDAVASIDADVEVVRADDVASELVARAHASDPPGLLCLSTRGRTAIGETVFGSVTAQVLRTLHASFLAVGPSMVDPRPSWRRMLVCLDGSAISASILPDVTMWASDLDLEVHLLYVAYPLGDPRIGHLLVPEETQEAREQLAAAADSLEAADVAVHWSIEEHTEVAGGIVEEAARRSVDLIAMATHGRTGLARLIAGSVTHGVVRRAPVPVLVLRPEQLT